MQGLAVQFSSVCPSDTLHPPSIDQFQLLIPFQPTFLLFFSLKHLIKTNQNQFASHFGFISSPSFQYYFRELQQASANFKNSKEMKNTEKVQVHFNNKALPNFLQAPTRVSLHIYPYIAHLRTKINTAK